MQHRFLQHRRHISQLVEDRVGAIRERTLETFHGALTRDSLKTVLTLRHDVVEEDYDTSTNNALVVHLIHYWKSWPTTLFLGRACSETGPAAGKARL